MSFAQWFGAVKGEKRSVAAPESNPSLPGGRRVRGYTISRLPFGAWCVLRLDMAPRRTGTPLPLRLRPRLDTSRPVMEYDSLRAAGQSPAQKQHP